MICERCHAGQMIEYRRSVGRGPKAAEIVGQRCDRCGFTLLDNDDDVWSAAGL